MTWWQALILGLVQGLTEFLPVSSSGHLMVFRNLLGVENPEGFLDFTVAVHFATVLSTIVVFRKSIAGLLRGLFRFRYNDETDYICKLLVSAIPVGLVGFIFKDRVDALFGDSLLFVGAGLVVTSVLLFLSDKSGPIRARIPAGTPGREARGGISYLQAFIVGVGQAFAVAPGVSRSGTTIATGLLGGVPRDKMAQFSFLMVLIPVIGEQGLEILKALLGGGTPAAGIGAVAIVTGALAAFLSGLAACRLMLALVRKASLRWFALYCLAAAALVFILG